LMHYVKWGLGLVKERSKIGGDIYLTIFESMKQ
jgi:hypothetical protein